MFYLDVSRDLAVAQIPKAGITTFLVWLGGSFIVVPNDHPDLMSASRRVAFFRHPLERLKSAYSMMYWQNDYGHPHDSGAPVDSWEAFVDYMLVNDNEHWRPQVEHVGDIPNTYHRFENLTTHWERYRPGILPHLNATTRLETNDYRAADLRDKYDADLVRWEASD